MSNKCILTNDVVKDFAKPVSENLVQHVKSFTDSIINPVMEDLLNLVPSISEYSSIIVNEYATRGISNNSSCDIFITIKSAEIELASTKKDRNNIRQHIRAFFKRFKISFSKKKIKKQNLDKQIEKIEKSNNLNYRKLKDLLFLLFTKYAPTTTIITNNPFSISLSDSTLLNSRVNIYVAMRKKYNHYILYNYSKRDKVIDIDFANRSLNFTKISLQTARKSVQLLKVINNIYSFLYNSVPNQIYSESLVYNCPMEIYKQNDDIYDILIQFVNYIINKNSSQLKSICNKNKFLFSDNLNTVNILHHNQFMRKIISLL